MSIDSYVVQNTHPHLVALSSTEERIQHIAWQFMLKHLVQSPRSEGVIVLESAWCESHLATHIIKMMDECGILWAYEKQRDGKPLVLKITVGGVTRRVHVFNFNVNDYVDLRGLSFGWALLEYGMRFGAVYQRVKCPNAKTLQTLRFEPLPKDTGVIL